MDQQSSRSIIVVAVIISLVTGTLFGSLSALFVTGFFGTKYLPEAIKSRYEKPAEEDTPEITGKTKVIKEESAIINVVKKASPAVVNIIITKDLPKIHDFGTPGDDFFNDLFPDFNDLPFSPFGKRQQQQNPKNDGEQKQEVGGGTGFIIDSSGLITTNKHVINDTKADYTVLMNDGKRYPAKVLGLDPVNDLGFLKINKTGLPTVKLGDSGGIEIGQTVVAIGNALGEFRNTVSVGVVSGLKRSIVAGSSASGSEQLSGVIQTDAAINFGNSGGPLLNLQGQVIGINTAVASQQSAQNIGFAIPINDAKNDIESVMKTGKIIKPFLGVRYLQIDKTVQEKYKLPVDHGAFVGGGENNSQPPVVPGSPADKAGIVKNDIILEVNGIKIDRQNFLAQIIGKQKVGNEIKLKLLRNGKEKELKIKLEAAKQQ